MARTKSERFASLFPSGCYRTLHAVHGHDSFLVDTEALARILTPFLEAIEPRPTVSVNTICAEVTA